MLDANPTYGVSYARVMARRRPSVLGLAGSGAAETATGTLTDYDEEAP
jgi:hypothetical protein